MNASIMKTQILLSMTSDVIKGHIRSYYNLKIIFFKPNLLSYEQRLSYL